MGLAASLPDGAITAANYSAVRGLWFQFIAPNIFCCLSVGARGPLLCCVTTECQWKCPQPWKCSAHTPEPIPSASRRYAVSNQVSGEIVKI